MNPCAHPPRDSSPHFRALPLNVGDVCLTFGSIKLPIVKLINGSRSTVTQITRRTQRDLEQDFTRNKLRPSIVGETRPKSAGLDWQPSVWYMATFGNDPLTSLPKLYQHFLMAVNLPAKVDHIHTTPEWQCASQQWVLALCYQPPKHFPLSERFTTKGNAEGTSSTEYRVDPDMMSLLEAFSESRSLQWHRLGRPKQAQFIAQFNRHVVNRTDELANSVGRPPNFQSHTRAVVTRSPDQSRCSPSSIRSKMSNLLREFPLPRFQQSRTDLNSLANVSRTSSSTTHTAAKPSTTRHRPTPVDVAAAKRPHACRSSHPSVADHNPYALLASLPPTPPSSPPILAC
ncbi:hypothetical protein JAAARDRAFT_73416 [Jaapia argillacea MUCL 33604]|uniref:Uncharacterized protein n=1 Tax=Jaapia argillacea MUCL 33604 TaxID=933084 RepID=A0A067PD39_9AGAM|nr:hypothetical protein JAAARDRAFT_73416 [Jaapia argillacea MUCL 33604]